MCEFDVVKKLLTMAVEVLSEHLWPTRTLSRLFSPALLTRICWPPRELNTEGWLVGLGNTAFEGLGFLKPAESYLYQNS